MGRDDGVARAGRQRDLADRLDLGRRVLRERVDRDDRRDPVDRDVLDLLREVLGAGPDGLDVLLEERGVERLAGHDLPDAAVHLERPDRGDHHGRRRHEPRRAALDVEELLGAHVGAEARLGADDVVGHQREPVGDDRVVAVGDVGERPGVDEGRAALERLEQVRLDRVAQEHGHRPGHAEVLRGHGRAVRPRREDDPPQPRPQVEEVGRQREDRHHLGADRDDELGLARDAVLATAQPDDGVPKRAVADVDDARPEDRRAGRCPSGFLWWRLLSMNAPARLCAAPIAWTSPVRWRLKSSIGMTWL